MLLSLVSLFDGGIGRDVIKRDTKSVVRHHLPPKSLFSVRFFCCLGDVHTNHVSSRKTGYHNYGSHKIAQIVSLFSLILAIFPGPGSNTELILWEVSGIIEMSTQDQLKTVLLGWNSFFLLCPILPFASTYLQYVGQLELSLLEQCRL